jgi:hypothetical protein
MSALKRRISCSVSAAVALPAFEAAQPAAPVAPVAPAASVGKTAVEKAKATAAAMAKAWAASNFVDEPLYGPGSGRFDLLNYVMKWKPTGFDSPEGEAAFKRIAGGSAGWKPPDAGPEKIFSCAPTARLCATTTQ